MSGMNMQWEESNSSGWALQSLPPKLVNKLTEFVEDSDNLVVDIDSIFHALGVKEPIHLDILVLLPGIGCIIEEHQFGDRVPMQSQDILPFDGMSRYRLESKSGEFTLNQFSGNKKIKHIDSFSEVQKWNHNEEFKEEVYNFDRVIRNPEKLREKIIQEFPNLDVDLNSDKSPIWCAVSCSDGYCDLFGVYQFGMTGINDSDVHAATESVQLISSAIHEIAFKMSKFRVKIHSSIYDRIADENISIPAAFLAKDAGLEYPMCVKLSDKICSELQVVKDIEVTIFRDNNYLYFTAEAPTTNPTILRVNFDDITNSNGKITSKSLRNSFSKSMAINRAKDGVSNSSFTRIRRSWREGENQVGSRIGIGLHLSTLNATFDDNSGRGEKWKLKIHAGNALLFEKLAPAMVHLCLARFDPSMRGEIRLSESKNGRKKSRNKSNNKHAKYYDWGHDKIRYIVPSVDGSRSKHWVNSHVRRMRISNPRTIEDYSKKGFPLNKIGEQTFGFKVIKGHFRGIGDLGDDFDYKFGKTPSYYSQKAIRWLNSIEKSQNISIQNAERGGEYRIPIGESYIQVDGWCRSTNTIYEFHGDVYHGNPEKFNSSDYCHPYDKQITAGDLYGKTTRREELIRALGFNLVVIWESDWDRIENKQIKV